ncbi:acyl-CoA synthetase [Novosphingobium marinum]|uniref:Acyl-CoA synthetase (AMP-forming)/AMP-acid ligase II n=1 Tax=Novosphingobium marinum TaxID=1514948 RepID=A0A7Y9XVR9_9SPHN|nr:AMP-binding protein [Novosphingobium marinum]NYH93991.1 acyl-CoA synthetase (AMP-forming)/AMP-acid ligase II [Novosphingobium marinum]GGC18767.1 acyl-CoA synthetase [Novosphingobium marinum]
MADSEAAGAYSEGAPFDETGFILISDYPDHFAAKWPERLAMIDDRRSWTYAQLDEDCNRFAAFLTRRGVGHGDRFAWKGKNSGLFIVATIAAARCGVVMVPVNWRNTAPETRFVLEDSGAKLIIADREFEAVVADANVNDAPCIIVDDDGPEGLPELVSACEPAPRDEIDPHADWLQLYTSGTTGKPKGVMTSQYAMAFMRHVERFLSGFAGWRDDEILLSPLPVFHIGGLSWVQTALCRGSTVYMTANTTPAGLLDMCLEHGVTRTFMVPTLVRALIEEMDKRSVRVETLKSIHYGAAAMDPQLLERSVDRLGCLFLQYYGMTEIGGTATVLEPEDHDTSRPQLLRSVGRPLPGIRIAIHDPETGKRLPVDVPGEIWIASPSLFRTYWNRPEATEAAMEGEWYKSGDGGRIDADGYLFLTDRIKDMVVSGGENVYPAEVEAVLRDHPAVQDCAVFGLPHPKWGEGVTAALELRPDASTTPDEVIAFARKSLAAYKVPRRIEIGVTLPRTASGKVQRGKIRQHFLDADEAS